VSDLAIDTSVEIPVTAGRGNLGDTYRVVPLR
jgi:hypothetical protein